MAVSSTPEAVEAASDNIDQEEEKEGRSDAGSLVLSPVSLVALGADFYRTLSLEFKKNLNCT